MNISMGQNNYGKSDVRLVKVFKNGARHDLKDVWIDVAMSGDFSAAHERGNNTGLIATDTVRNTIYALAKDGFTSSIENFGVTLAKHFLSSGKFVTGVRVNLIQHSWQRMNIEGQAHDHGFLRQTGKHTATVEADQLEGEEVFFRITSGLDDLFVLKTTNSGWEGFDRDEFTSLPETNDRILATVVTAKWLYNQEQIDHDQIWMAVQNQILKSFTDHYSPSVQNTLYRMGKAVLEEFLQIEKIHFSLPNRHHIAYNLERFGLKNENQIFHADAEPFGLIEGWVERS